MLCSDLSSVVIGDGVKNIERLTFLLCTNLSSVTIGNSVESIKYGAFMRCTGLTSVNIPNSVTTIASEAFEECSSLSSVVIGNSVTSIDEQAFRLCSSLADVYSYSEQVPQCHWSSFSGSNYKHATLHVPAASISAYQAVEPWKSFKEIVALPVQDVTQNDYIPLVKKGKQWHMVVSKGFECNMMKYMLMNEEVVKDGKTYFRLYSSQGEIVHDLGLLREEGQKVFFYDYDMQEEFLLFDYSLKPGDTFETFSYDDYKKVSYKVMSVGECLEGPEVIYYDYKTHRRYLREWTICRTDNNCEKTWIEGIGSYEGPMANLYDARPVSSAVYLAYVDNFYGDLYLPFSFQDRLWRWAYGCDLPTGEAGHSNNDSHHLTYELEGDRLHVYGEVYTQCGPNNYAYFIISPETLLSFELYGDPSIRKFNFIIQGAQPTMDCIALRSVDFYVPGFDPSLNYIIVDNQGEEHQVINKTNQMAYRPMIEKGKVWKVGSTLVTDNLVKLVGYYYFDGDTIIGGKTCKQMMCQRYVNPEYPDYAIVMRYPLLQYVGAWYEEDKKVYFYNETNNQFKLMYDFSLDANDTLWIDGFYSYVIGPRQKEGIKGFKGMYRDVMMTWEGEQSIYNTTWLEGVGGIDSPTVNVYYGKENHALFLMSCSVDDEVIYLNDEFEDGATPEEMNAKKQRFDFTHTIKTKPQAPMRRETARPLYGEYNNLRLGINLDPLDDAYLVRITDETGKVVYEKNINAGNIVGLNIDISSYAEGRYTVTVENSQESFTGEFETVTTGIEEINLTPALSQGRGVIYNLQGQRISSLQKGMNIVNGQKVYVK